MDDPFSISLADYLNIDYAKFVELQSEVSRRCKGLLEAAWKNGKRQIIICGGKVVYETDDNKDVSNEMVNKLADKYKKPCYVFTHDQYEEVLE